MKYLWLCGLLALGATFSASSAQAGVCGWKDGSDAAAPPGDGGRGVADWLAHQNYVLQGAGLSNAHDLVSTRLSTLKGCIDKNNYARLYADVSVLIAHYGRKGAGWVDSMDTAAPPGDAGRGISNWGAHQSYAIQDPGAGNANKLVGDRLKTLSTKLSKAEYAHVYADVSILIGSYGRNL